MSFALTTEQVRNRTKTVTRRNGWRFLKVGDVVNAVVKSRGIPKGGKVQRICRIRVVDVRQEKLSKLRDKPLYGSEEAKKEGFPEMTGDEFVDMFMRHNSGPEIQTVTRIEFEYLDSKGRAR